MDAAGPAVFELDDVDRRILALVQVNSRLSTEALAAAVNLSASAVQRRLQALRRAKVITGEVALVDPKRVGRPLTMLVELAIEREGAALLAALHRWLLAEPAVQQAWYATGPADFVMVVTAASTDEFDSLMERMLAENSNVRRFTTSVVLREVKRSLFVPTGI